MVPTHVPDVTGMTVLEAALTYAEAGFMVIPINGKHPAVPKGVSWQTETATRDADRIRTWYPDDHTKGVAIVTGKSGVIALDVDNPTAVPDWMWAEMEGAAVHRTRKIEVRRAHYVFLQPDPDNPFGDSTGELPAGFGETKGSGYIVAEPSPHERAAEGGEYKWLSSELRVLPEAIASKLTVRSKVSGDQSSVADLAESLTKSDSPEKLETILRHAQKRLEDGDARHDVFRDSMGWATRWSAAGYFAYQTAYDTLYSMWGEVVATNPKPGDAGRNFEAEWEGFAEYTAKGVNVREERNKRLKEEEELRTTGALRTADGGSPGQLPAEVWEHCENTCYIREVAHAHLASAPAVLLSVLARMAAMVPPGTRAASAARGDIPLNLGVNVVGLSGGGKSTIRRIPKSLIPAPDAMGPDRFLDGGQLSTGQGLTAAFLGKKEEGTGEFREGKNGEQIEVTREVTAVVRPHVLMTLDEGGVFVKNRDMAGSVTGLAVRSAVTGDDLGQQNANDPRLVPAGSYSFGLVMNFQPATAVPLFTDEEVTGGTPQRFIWTTTDDDETPKVGEIEGGEDDYSYDEIHQDIKPLPVDPFACVPNEEDPFVAAGSPGPLRVLYPRAVRNINDREIMGETRSPSPLDSHRPGLRSKLAALFALLAGRDKVTMADWKVAGLVWDASCEVRDAVVALGKAQRAEEAREAREAYVSREVAAQRALRADEEEARENQFSKMLQDILARIKENGGRVKVAGKGNLRQSFSGRRRKEFDATLEEALLDGVLSMDDDGWLQAEF